MQVRSCCFFLRMEKQQLPGDRDEAGQVSKQSLLGMLSTRFLLVALSADGKAGLPDQAHKPPLDFPGVIDTALDCLAYAHKYLCTEIHGDTHVDIDIYTHARAFQMCALSPTQMHARRYTQTQTTNTRPPLLLHPTHTHMLIFLTVLHTCPWAHIPSAHTCTTT